jgi:NTP pyrophosphatase (non-canonical NTP hydrolase)
MRSNMETKEYSDRAIKFVGSGDQITHACFGIGGESGEILDSVKKSVFYHRPLDQPHLVEEIGDLCWYVNLLIHSIGTTWDEVLATNIRKLEARYPNSQFNTNRAINRDKEAEQRAMRG